MTYTRAGATHAGADFHASGGDVIKSPVTGKIVYYQTLNGGGKVDPQQTVVVVRDQATGRDYVLGHISCTYCRINQMKADTLVPENRALNVRAGEPIGVVLKQEHAHFHFGINKGQIVDKDGRLIEKYQHGRWGAIGPDNSRGAERNSEFEREKTIIRDGWIDPLSQSGLSSLR